MNTNTSIRKNLLRGLSRGVTAGVALSVIAMLAGAPSAQAALSVDTIAYCTNNTSGPCPSSQTRQSGINETNPWSGPPLTANTSNGHTGVQSQAYASADYGVLKVSGHAEAMGGLPSNLSNIGDAQATAIWNDQITVTSDGLARGTEAILTVNFAIGGGFTRNGELAVNPGAFDAFTAATQATWDVYLWDHSYNYRGSHDGALFQGGGGYDNYWINNVPASGMFGDFTFTAPILLGERFGISMELYGRTYALAKGEYTRAWSDFDLGQSAYWGGISSLTVNGQEVAFNLTSLSGHDWRQSSIPSAVPLPAAAWLFGSGLLGLIGIARRKTHRDASTD